MTQQNTTEIQSTHSRPFEHWIASRAIDKKNVREASARRIYKTHYMTRCLGTIGWKEVIEKRTAKAQCGLLYCCIVSLYLI